MSGHRPFGDLFAKLPPGRQRQIDADVAATVTEMEQTISHPASKFVIYRGPEGLFRWRLVAADGKVLAASDEAFNDRPDCLDSIERLRIASSTSAVEEAA
jgi:uncharacterized protein YegP (UPF0339 family)